MFYWALLFGALPDLLSFGVFFVANILGISPRPDWSAGTPPMDAIPQYVHVLYNISHSLVIFVIITSIVWIWARKWFVPFLAYGFAVALDIPTHGAEFFPTPFLWPVSNFHVNGTPWGHPWIFLPNVILLIATYAVWYAVVKWKSRRIG